MNCLRAILRVTWCDRLSNIEIRKSLNVYVQVETIEEVIVKKQLRWFDNVARNSDMSNAS